MNYDLQTAATHLIPLLPMSNEPFHYMSLANTRF